MITQDPNAASCCLVCFDANAAKHYGSVCCSGCKGFFRRTVRFGRKYVCHNNNACPIKTEYRNCCRACRYTRCLQAGLNPMLVHSDRGAINRKGEASKDTPKAVKTEVPDPDDTYDHKARGPKGCKEEYEEVESKPQTVAHRSNYSSFDMDTEYEHWFALVTNASKRLSEANTLPLGTMRIIPEFDRKSVSGVANYYVLVDRLCDAYYDSEASHLLSSEAEYTHSLEISAENAFKKPRAVSARTRIDWPARFHCNAKFMKRVWCRIVGIYTDWASHIPEVMELDDRDRTILFVERTVPVVNLQVAYKAVQYNTPGIPMSGGAYFPFNPEEQKLVDSNIQPYLHRLVNFLHNEFVIPARELGLTEKEFVVMKLILFFSASSAISPKGKETINRSRRFYRNILCKTVQEEFPHYEIDETLQRVAAIMDLLPRIEQARTIEDEDFSVMTIFNIGDMKGSLTYDVHIKKGVDLFN